MYARIAAGRELTFGVSGMLWHRSLVMYDRETDSLWSHILGEAQSGTLKGTQLEQIPSVMTDWDSWRKKHPDGTVAWLSRTTVNYRREFYGRLDEFVLGVASDGDAKAWTFSTLNKSPIVYDTWKKREILVVFDPGSVTGRAYGRGIDGETLAFRFEKELLKDDQTNSTWDLVTGKAIDGPLKGKHLTPLPAIVSFRKVWLQFHPKSVMR